jgi:restriction system protein
MAVPPFQEILLPLLRHSADGKDWTLAALRGPIADDFGLTDAERAELLPSGTQSRFVNRLCWAKIYLERAGLLTRVRRGVFSISDAGRQVLAENPASIDLDYLNRFESFRDFRQQRGSGDGDFTEPNPSPIATTETPEDILEKAHTALNEALAEELLDEIVDRSPQFFERVVLGLMKAMGYGGWGDAAGRLTSAGADEGIDGLIHEDRLGLETIYLQAKRWTDKTVGRPEIHKFVGALHGLRARKGVFVTTSDFSREAEEYAKQIDTKIVLIDGRKLANLMILHDVGCSPVQTFVVKKLDSDYFVEE